MTIRKTPAPPKTRSGEMPAVKAFREAIEKANDEALPQMDAQVDRMSELLKKVSASPDKSDRVNTPIPIAPRTPSFVDEAEREAFTRAPPDAPTTKQLRRAVDEAAADDEPDSGDDPQ